MEDFTPEEQRLIEQLYLQAAEIIHGKAADSIVQKLGSEDPIEGLAGAAVEITKLVETQAEEAMGGKELPEGVLMMAGVRITDELTDVAIAAGIIDQAQAEEVASMAFPEAVRRYSQERVDQGRVSPERRQRAEADIEAFRQSGEFEEFFNPGSSRPLSNGQSDAGSRHPGAPGALQRGLLSGAAARAQ